MPTTTEPEPAARSPARTTLLWALVAGLLAIPAVAVALLFHGYQILDDAHFYTRYARNLLAEGALIWNPGTDPDFGPTSVAYVLVVLPFVAAFGELPALAILSASTACGVAFVIALLWLVHRTCERGLRGAAVALVAFSLASAALSFGVLLTSGMDTALAMLWATLMLGAFAAHEHRPRRIRAVLAGLLGGLAFAVRADLLLFAFAIPLAGALLGAERAQRRSWILTGLVAAGVLALELLAAWIYFGRPLPLSFHAKGVRFFSDEMYVMFADTPRHELARFVIAYRFLVAIVAFDVVLSPRRWWRETGIVEKGAAAAAIAFVGYYLLLVLQMLGFNSRFYYPTLPVLAWLAARSLGRIAPLLVERIRSAPISGLALGSGLLVLAAAPSLLAVRDHEPQDRALAQRLGRFDLAAHLDAIRDPSVWFGLPALAKLPEDLVIATTEVGMPGILCPHQTIADLSGLNDGWILDAGEFDGARYLAERQPDVIYMPYDTYPHLDRELRDSAMFREGYELFDIGTGVAVRRTSPHYEAIRTIMASRR